MTRPAIMLFLALALPAHAQVYKCTEGGKTVYSQTPCASDAQPLDLKVHQPTEADRLRAEAAHLINQAANARTDGENAAARRRANAAADARQASADEKARKCAQYERDIKRLNGTKDKWFTPVFRHQDREQVKDLEAKHFSECFAR